MASIGSRFDAFFAGYHPKNTPVIVHTANDSTTEYPSITTGQFSANLEIEKNIYKSNRLIDEYVTKKAKFNT